MHLPLFLNSTTVDGFHLHEVVLHARRPRNAVSVGNHLAHVWRHGMDLKDLLIEKGIDPRQVLVLRHRPSEPRFNKALRRWAAEKPDMFNAYPQTQTRKVEKAMTGAGYVASFIGHAPGKALFVGLYSIGASRPLTSKEYAQVPAHIEMKEKLWRGIHRRRRSTDRKSVV